ncbi:hypothetical protein D187_005479 [Cystobacter fuscus DSM 2262]|uniref:DUF4276 family protein n=1 Tax=Cystobacter fuscus (strain ATCC 25194 / DSM 2262 / NBRC 100088 / M29) TaxID=1242864 RepID=S9PJ68_CYSF2|nr:DUF4276 family protein [Cystobacter fuscus]EPX64345.1 hypothetical protein D187_005479 [Cystobacter fuscus DSM 2262]
MRPKLRILAIVEGHGEQTAVPVLLRRWFQHRRFREFETPDLAIRASGAGALKCPHDADDELGIEYYVEMAARERPDGILVLLDSDDECQERARTSRRGLGPELLERAREVAPHIPIEVVVAHREYEVWFLAALASLRRAGHLPRAARLPTPLSDIETIRDCKKRLKPLLGRPYEETTDQPDFTGALPFTPAMARRSRSYRKLLKSLEALTRAARENRNRRRPSSGRM